MKFFQSKDAASGQEVKIAYQDLGQGRPVVLIHGWPSSSQMWEYQLNTLPNHGLRCIAYDRRGFGHSEKPYTGYDYDALAGDLHQLLEHLDLRVAVLVGFSMGGGEVVRYLSHYGTDRVSKAVLIGAVPPFLLKTDNNPDGVPQDFFDDMEQDIRNDRMAFLDGFGKKFFGVTEVLGITTGGGGMSKPLLDYFYFLTTISSPQATIESMKAWATTDFRPEMARVTVPTLIIHGDADKNVDIKISSEKSAKMIPDNEFKIYEGEPHGLFYTAKDRLNKDLTAFCSR